MKLVFVYAQLNSQSLKIAEVLKEVPNVTSLDAYDPVIHLAMEGIGISAVPTVIFQREDGTEFARLDGELCTPEAVQQLLAGKALLVASRIQPPATVPYHVKVVAADVADESTHELMLNGTLLQEVTLAAGETEFEVIFPDPGVHILSLDGIDVEITVLDAPVMPPEVTSAP